MGVQYERVQQCIESLVGPRKRLDYPHTDAADSVVGAHPDVDADDGECNIQSQTLIEKPVVVEIAVDDSSAAAEKAHGEVKQQTQQSRTVFLNGLRGLAALSVAYGHAGYLKTTATGSVSVDTFFVLSSFLLTMLNEAKFRKMIKSKAAAREWVVTLVDYLVKRILRVYPLFAAVVIVLTCMSADMRNLHYNLKPYHIKEWSAFDVLTFADGHRYYLFWTLPIEITYYFVIPLFVAGAYLLGRLKWVAVALLYVWVIHDGATMHRRDHQHFRPHLSPFVAGSLAATVYGGVDRWVKKCSFKPRTWQLVALRIIEAVMIGTWVSDTIHGLFARWFSGSIFPHFNQDQPAVCIPVSTVIVIEILAPSTISRALEWNVLCYAGKISFSIYLLHPFIDFNPWVHALPLYDQFVVRFVLFFLLGSASHFLVERPMQLLAAAIGKRLVRYKGN